MSDLGERVAREKAAYDAGTVVRESRALQTRFHHLFACPNSLRAERYLDRVVVRHAAGRDLLDYGCFDGGMVPRYIAMRPHSITGLDVSVTGIAQAIARYGRRAEFHLGDAHRLPFPAASFDLVVGRAILHHLDLALAVAEIRRVLRPGGHAIFVEPLRGNPVAKLLRALTPRARTGDETPLSRHDILSADALFGASSHHFFNLLSVPVAMLTSLSPLGANRLLLRLADVADRLLARTPLRYWMRAVVLVWQRQDG